MGKLKEFYEKHETGILYGIVACEMLAVGFVGYKLGHRAGFVSGRKSAWTEVFTMFENTAKLPGEKGTLIPLPDLGTDILLVGDRQLKAGFDKAVEEELTDRLADAIAKED